VKAEWKEKWIAALESGKYEQGRDRLRRNDDTFCCLGVLCDIVNVSGWFKDDDGDWQHGTPGLAGFATLTPEVRQVAGISDTEALRDHEGELARKNDCGQPFTEIAQWIRENM
jgi:hypothetical protein